MPSSRKRIGMALLVLNRYLRGPVPHSTHVRGGGTRCTEARNVASGASSIAVRAAGLSCGARTLPALAAHAMVVGVQWGEARTCSWRNKRRP
jgi:hypothetical protein